MTSLLVYLDADVLIAGAASPNDYSAAQVACTLSEITLLEAMTSSLAMTECRRNIEAKFERHSEVIERFDDLVRRAVTVVEAPSSEQVRRYAPYAHWKDAPHLASAAEHGCRYLVTYNVADYHIEAEHSGAEHSGSEHTADQGSGEQQVEDAPEADGARRVPGSLNSLDVIRPGALVRTVRAQLAGL